MPSPTTSKPNFFVRIDAEAPNSIAAMPQLNISLMEYIYKADGKSTQSEHTKWATINE